MAMWNWLPRFVPAAPARKKAPTRSSSGSGRWFLRNPNVPPTPRQRLSLEQLEQREVPAVNILFDYSFDTAGFFNDPARRAILQQAANDIGGQINTQLGGLIPDGVNTWTATFYNPATGQQASVANPIVPGNTIVVYAGARSMPGTEAGQGGNGGYSASGYQPWFDMLATRATGHNTIWGGSLAFDTGTNWYFGTGSPGGSQVDFYSVASHELGHILGIGTSQQWAAYSSNGHFYGPNADAVYGGAVPLSPDGDHWADGATVGGRSVAMDPVLNYGTRVPFSSLDFAALADLGWSIGPSAPAPAPVPPPPAPPPFTPVNLGSGVNPVVLTGETDGTAQVFSLGSDGSLHPAGGAFSPFPGYVGTIRSVVADFNGDGTADYAFATGPGTAATVHVIDGKTGGSLAGPTHVFEGFGGGLYLAAGDLDRDGRAELVVSADAGGGNRIGVFRVQNGGLQTAADFLAFNDPNFRGGSRVAVGDVNRDGAADIIVGAGLGGGPRVSIYSGRAVMGGQPTTLVPDFFALDPNLRTGVFVTAADLDGDGFADVAYSTGTGGGPRVRIVGGKTLTDNPGVNAFYLPAMADVFVLDPNDRSGVRLIARDLNADGRAELVAASGATWNPVVRVIPWSQLSSGSVSSSATDPFANPATVDGLYVG